MKRNERRSMFTNVFTFKTVKTVHAFHMWLSYVNYSVNALINKFYKNVCMSPERAGI